MNKLCQDVKKYYDKKIDKYLILGKEKKTNNKNLLNNINNVGIE